MILQCVIVLLRAAFGGVVGCLGCCQRLHIYVDTSMVFNATRVGLAGVEVRWLVA